MRILELFSGIGGMHFALKESNVEGEIVAAIDINTTANLVYKHNFPDANVLNKNIQGLTGDFLKKLNVDTILMSPPCQPFTRNGLKKDTKDARSSAFLHLLNILPELDIENILIENVKGFEESEMRKVLIEHLERSQYIYQEFILSPHQFGIPNTRHRYYCLAKKLPRKFSFEVGPIEESIKLFNTSNQPSSISQFLENNVDVLLYLLPEKVLRKYPTILDICFPHSERSCCFTKAYGKYIEGTGSVFTEKPEHEFHEVYKSIQLLDADSEEYVNQLKKLNLRFFTPIEIAHLMSFPRYFSFPEISNKQKYMLLGNSINVKVVAE
ncbi:hypothetical protein AMK59_3485, partial [Oryctes borbonicus]